MVQVVYSSQRHVQCGNLHLFPVSSSPLYNLKQEQALTGTSRCLSIFLCTPVSGYWTIGTPEGQCLNEGTATLVAGIINCVADLTTTITPLPLVMGLHMPRRQRIAVAMLFSMGMIVTVAGIVRTWYIYKSLVLEYDNTWYAFPLWIAAAVEIDLGVVSLFESLRKYIAINNGLDMCISTRTPTPHLQDSL